MNHSVQQPTVRLITTGGTIAMRYDAALNASVPALDGEALLAIVPELSCYADIDLDNFGNKPSAHMQMSDCIALHQRVKDALADNTVSAVVITHGTDTLEDNAFFLNVSLCTSKPVVMVGALRDASAANGDGPGNLLNAVRVAVNGETIKNAKRLGVLVVMHGRICAARDVRKNHTTDIAAFTCGDAGYLGLVGQANNGGVNNTPLHFDRLPSNKLLGLSLALSQHSVASGQLPRVDIVSMYPGADAALLEAAIAAGAKGLVIQALGAGNLNLAFYAAIKSAIKKTIPVVITSRVANGAVEPAYGFEGGGQTLQQLGAIFAGDLPAHKARIVLMLALQHVNPSTSNNSSSQTSNSTPQAASDLQQLFYQFL